MSHPLPPLPGFGLSVKTDAHISSERAWNRKNLGLFWLLLLHIIVYHHTII